MNGRKCGRDGMWMIEASSGVVLRFVLFLSFSLSFSLSLTLLIRVEIFWFQKILLEILSNLIE